MIKLNSSPVLASFLAQAWLASQLLMNEVWAGRSQNCAGEENGGSKSCLTLKGQWTGLLGFLWVALGRMAHLTTNHKEAIARGRYPNL